jgi:DNA ligase-1
MQKSAFANKRGTTVGDVKFFVFGYVSYSEWNEKSFSMKTSERLDKLANLKSSFEENIVMVDQKFITSSEDAYKFEAECMALGYEGAMLLPDIPYYLGKKSNKLLKLKTMKSQDCRIVDLYEGEAGSRNDGVMGGVDLVQENGVTCRCGSGFTDADRSYMWNNRAEFIGKIAEIKYQELTEDRVMRFPVFLRWRNDK